MNMQQTMKTRGMAGLRAHMGLAPNLDVQPDANLPAVAPAKGISARLADPATLSRFAAVIPKSTGLTVQRFMGALMTEVKNIPKLLKCAPNELLGAAIRIAELGLVPGAALGHAYILPFWNDKKGIMQAQVILGYKGMIELAYRNGLVASIKATPVFHGDQFDWCEDENGVHFKHVPDLLNPNRGNPAKIALVYAVARMTSGGCIPLFMTRAEIDMLRQRSTQARNNPVWNSDWEQMAVKTLIRRLFKYLPVSVEAQQAAALDDRDDQQNADAFAGDAQDVDFTEPQAAPGAGQDADPFEMNGSAQTARTIDPQTGEIGNDADEGLEPDTADFSPLGQKIWSAMERATSLDTLEVAADEIRELSNEAQRQQLAAFFRERRATFDM
jgi:recombination protein RecT